MTFQKLHAGLDKRCKCQELGPAVENFTYTFARRVDNDPPTDLDFRSEHEKRNETRNNCYQNCKWRGVSMNRITPDNEIELIEDWRDIIRNATRERLGKLQFKACKFRLKRGSGLVWDTRTERNPSHYDLLKADTFSVGTVEIIEIVSLL